MPLPWQSLPIWLVTLSSSAVAYVGSLTIGTDRASPARRPTAARVVRLPRAADGLFHVRVTIDGVSTDAVLDTGANRSILGRGIGDRVRGAPLASTGASLRTINGRVRYAIVPVTRLTVEGFDLGSIRAIVGPGGSAPIVLGQDAIARFGSITIAADVLELR